MVVIVLASPSNLICKWKEFGQICLRNLIPAPLETELHPELPKTTLAQACFALLRRICGRKEPVASPQKKMMQSWFIEAAYTPVNLSIIDPDNGLSPYRRQAIIWTNTGMLSSWPIGRIFDEHVLQTQQLSSKKMNWNTSSAKKRGVGAIFCLGRNVLTLFSIRKMKHKPNHSNPWIQG